jgi:2-iminoacetate synthase ThiH
MAPPEKLATLRYRTSGQQKRPPENVVSAAGCTNSTSEGELRRLILDAGFRPIKRDTLYGTYFLN